MKNHLSDKQLNEWILGSAGSDTSRHLDSCATCRREADRLREALKGFRESIRTVAEDYKMPWRTPPQPARPAWAGFMAQRWAYAAAVAAIVVVSVVLLRVGHQRAPYPAPGAHEDEILIEIQADVSEDVPSALAPGELLLAAAEEQPSPAPAGAARQTQKAGRR